MNPNSGRFGGTWAFTFTFVMSAALTALGCSAGPGTAGDTAVGPQSDGRLSEIRDARAELSQDGRSDAVAESPAMLSCDNVGCSLPPLCDQGCQAPCGCCSCADGEATAINGVAVRCTGGCYVPLVDGGAEASDRRDGDNAVDGPACGERTCGASQICVYEYCGGGPAQCVAPGDGGLCPDRWSLMIGEICPATCQPGCAPPSCNNPPPHCADVPPACTNRVDCSCIPSAVCDGIPCAMVSRSTVTCAAQ
jgi:hypothetical protein